MYEKEIWKTGDVITKEKLNHIEEGIGEGAYALETKAEIDGYYEGMTVGNAEQMVSTKMVEESEPYLFRTSGGSTDIGNRSYDKIVGGTVAWNQLINTSDFKTTTMEGVTFVVNGDGTITANGEATNHAMVSTRKNFVHNHVYCLLGSPKDGTNSTYYLDTGASIGRDYGNGLVGKFTGASGSYYVRPYVRGGANANNLIFKPQLIDLTAMLGTTIADYIYNLEQATVGAGVAWFKKLFPADYYEYNAGELLSVEGLESHDTVGFNQWDEEWEVGNIDSGNPTVANDRIRSKNYIPVVGGATYYTTSRICWYEYDADKNFIKVGNNGSFVENETFTVSSNCIFIKFKCMTAYGTTYNHDICINFSWSGYRNGEYEEYVKHSYPLDNSLTLRGIPKLDASNNLYYDGDTYESDGSVTRKYGVVDLGTLNWAKTTQYNNPVFLADIPNIKLPATTSILANAICSIYKQVTAVDSNVAGANKVFAIGKYYNSHYTLNVIDTSYSDATAFKTAMDGVYLVYELATPTTETADPYTNPQIVDDFGTEEYVTDSIVPVGHVTEYPANLRDKLQHLPNMAESDGKYLIIQEGRQMLLAPYSAPAGLPTAPTTDGAYTLKCTVQDGTSVYSWEV